ncbi:MAG TPA: hypothetical protein VEP90_19920 [Methylomirabilota bacterium]|nr:hypothetical protein [Methylomirabilota bacterium]
MSVLWEDNGPGEPNQQPLVVVLINLNNSKKGTVDDYTSFAGAYRPWSTKRLVPMSYSIGD